MSDLLARSIVAPIRAAWGSDDLSSRCPDVEIPILKVGHQRADTRILPAPRPAHAVGTPVEVRNRSLATWSEGFEVAERAGSGYRVRRRSDGYVLPTVFGPTEVRPLPDAAITPPGDRTSRADAW